MRVLVTGSSTFFATRLIHDLGRRGVEVTAADSLRLSPGKCSRCTSRGLRVPMLRNDPGGYLAAIQSELARRDYDLLLPTFEESLLFAEYQAELRTQTHLFLPSFFAMQQLHHKPSLCKLCDKLGLPAPQTVVLRDAEDLRSVPEKMSFPVVIKLSMANNSVGRTYCDNWEELQHNFSELAAQQLSHGAELPFVQKKIEGDLVFTLCCSSEGRKVAELVYRTLRTFPEAGGTAAHRESISHPEISQIADKLIAATNWTGFLGLDFIVERSTGIPYLIDANTRSNTAVHLGFMAGLDWSQIFFDMLAGRTPATQTAKVGLYSRNLLLDMSWLLEGLVPGRASLWNFPQRFLRYMKPAWPVHSYDDLVSVGEVIPAAIIGLHAVCSVAKSAIVGRQIGQVLLEDVNYDPVTAAAFRMQRREEIRRQNSSQFRNQGRRNRLASTPAIA